jgi:hypothetical protein
MWYEQKLNHIFQNVWAIKLHGVEVVLGANGKMMMVFGLPNCLG